MKNDEKNLKLIYILKVGYNSKNEGIYEFIFSKDETNIDIEEWKWDISPACDNALPPSEEYIDMIISLKTKSFDLICLHEAVDREYMHGYFNIHALAYENLNNKENYYYEQDMPLLVFHYGMTLEKIKDMLNTRNFILKNNEFIETSSIKI